MISAQMLFASKISSKITHGFRQLSCTKTAAKEVNFGNN